MNLADLINLSANVGGVVAVVWMFLKSLRHIIDSFERTNERLVGRLEAQIARCVCPYQGATDPEAG